MTGTVRAGAPHVESKAASVVFSHPESEEPASQVPAGDVGHEVPRQVAFSADATTRAGEQQR